MRTVKVMLDQDLAGLYGVTTGRLNQALKRNERRFPRDFAFRLTVAEWRNLKSQSVISNGGRGGRRTPPWVFTEHGAIMAASMLNTTRAIDMSVFVVRAFLRLRDISKSHRVLGAKLDDLERRVSGHDDELKSIIAALRKLIQQPPPGPRRTIGFATATAVSPVSAGRGARRHGRRLDP